MKSTVMAPCVPGISMPLAGLGQAGIIEPDAEVITERTVERAVELGYRYFDTAYSYGNECSIGNALKRCMERELVSREELFIVTKLPCIGMNSDLVEKFLRLSLKNLKVDYVDLYLIHWPIGFTYHGAPHVLFPKKQTADGGLELDLDFTTDLVRIWKTMEEVCGKGLTRHIGLSNFNQSQITRILNIATIPPLNLQVELHAYLQQPDLVEFCRDRGISLCAYAPLGSPGRAELYKKRGLHVKFDPLMDDPLVQELAVSYHRTPAQILLRFLVQQNIAVIPRTVNPDRLQSNINIFDFELKGEDINRLKRLDRGEKGRTFDFSAAPEVREHPEFPFHQDSIVSS